MFNKELEFTQEHFLQIVQEIQEIENIRTRSLTEIAFCLWLGYSTWMKPSERKAWLKLHPSDDRRNIDKITNVRLRAYRRLYPYLGKRLDHPPFFSPGKEYTDLMNAYLRHHRSKDLEPGRYL